MDSPDSSRPPQSVTGGGGRADEVRALLNHRYRRYVVRRVMRADRPMMLERLAIEIAALEREVPAAEVRLETADRVCTALQRAHLPKLADESIIDYDESKGTIVLAEAAVELGRSGAGGDSDD